MSRGAVAAAVAALLLSGFNLVGCGSASRSRAYAEIHDAGGRRIGMATLIGRRDGVVVRMHVQGLPPGPHGTHIHEAASCIPPDFESAGPHFDHTGAGHDHSSQQGHHSGDLPNLVVGEDGKGDMDVLVPGLTLEGDGLHSLFRRGGTSIVIHEDVDDMKSEPSGHSGPRIACGVIRMGEP
jgi:superoxide dismutase, Cu-Zn family